MIFHFEIGHGRWIWKLEKQKRACQSKYWKNNFPINQILTLFIQQAEILRLNDVTLNDAEKIYSTRMNDWLRSATPFATSEQLFMHHQEIQETTANYLKSRLKGPNELIPPTNDRLKKVLLLFIHLFKFIRKHISHFT